MSRFKTIYCRNDLADLIRQVGILPFFDNRVHGWSVEENIDPGVWFTGDDGPWEWKGPLACEKICVYGKFIRGKAAFVRPDWFAELANYRRGGYVAFDDMDEAGEAPRRDRLLMRYVAAHPGELSKYARRESGVDRGYEAVLTRLEMQTWIINQDFRYSVDRQGRPYGWGNAALIRPEDWLDGFALPDRTPEESFERIVAHLRGLMPDVDEALLRRELK